jgi:type IV secretion system protein VirD4
MTEFDTFCLICLVGGLALVALSRLAGFARPAKSAARASSARGYRFGQFCRACLLLGIGLWLLLAAGLALAALAYAPQLFLVLAAVAVVAGLYARRRIFGEGWAFGTARWAGLKDLLRAGMLRHGEGLLVGKKAPPSLAEATGILKDASPAEAEDAARLFRSSFRKEGPWVRLARGTHSVCFAPTGRGKGTGLVVPNLLTYPGSCVVIDPKGENAKLTAEYRRRVFGQRVVILDPFRLVTQTPDSFNPLEAISRDSATALDDARAIAEALVVRTGEEREPHWNDSAELWIWAMTALTLYQAPDNCRNLQTVCTLLSNPAEMQGAIKFMQKSNAWQGMLARLGHQLSHFVDRELGSTLTTAGRHLRFLSTLAVSESTVKSSFDPSGLREGMTVDLVLPTEYLRTQSPLLRLWVSSLFRAIVRGGLGEQSKVLFLLDEAAALGHMDCIDDAVAQLRGYGLRLFFFYQSMGQLKLCFPEGKDQTFLSNMDNQVFFGLNDVETAEYVSTRLGEATISIWQDSGGESSSTNYDPQGQASRSVSSNTGWNASETARKLLKPEEVLSLPERQAVVFTPEAPPFITRLVRHYEPEFQTAPGMNEGSERRQLAQWCLGFALAAILAAGLMLWALATTTV